MVEWVIEYDTLILYQIFSFITDAHPRTLRANQRQVYTQLLAGGTVVWSDMGAWSQGREETVTVVSRNDWLEDFNSARNFGAIFFKPDIVQIEIKDVPVARIMPVWPNLISRYVVLVGICWGSVRLEACRFPQGQQLFSYHISLGFQSADPLELRSFPPGP